MAATMGSGQQGPPPAGVQPLPLFDLFLDLPHPAASASCPPAVIVGAPMNNVDIEKELSANLPRISRFAFPEFDDAAGKVPRETALNRFSQYAMQPKTFQHYTFSLQLQSGVRLHGHVRRCLPTHPIARTRYDVGRRGERALVILTRVSGGDLVYSAIAKTIDAMTFQKSSIDNAPHAEPQKWFLHRIFHAHQQLCAQFSTLPIQDKKPMILNVEELEVGKSPVPLMNQVDTARFLIPTTMLSPASTAVESVTASSILPLLRVLGVSNALRLLSAMLSECRILLISTSPTRLSQCARSALSILAQGLLHWQHLFIPVLPPHLFQYLAAPVPYLIGILTSLAPRLDQANAQDSFGEMVIINLDQNSMETRGINAEETLQKIPDLFRTAMNDQGLPSASMSASEMLAQDLVDLLKVDKRTLYGESTLTNVSETAAKATKAMKTGFMKLKQKGKQLLTKTSSNVSDGGGTDDDSGELPAGETGINPLLPDFIYTQGSQNEAAEEEARIAFTSFFLSMFGNMRWYLSASPGKLPQLDHKRYLQQKRAMGEGEQTPIWPLLLNFCQTQMLEEFAKARVEEVRTRQQITTDSPLFSQCANYHRLHNIDFSVVNVRRVARQVAQNNPSRQILQTSARRMCMLLTSNRTFEGDYNKAVAQLVEQCRECSSVLFDVMSVIWVRLRDSKGIHWKHGHQSLQILRNLLYHGPLGAVAEATDGLDKIRLMKFYNDNMRSQICTQIRQAATQVYSLLVDRAKLFSIRRLCINKRRTLRKPDQGRLTRDPSVQITFPFKTVHAAFQPKARMQVAPLPQTSAAPLPTFSAEQDLLGLSNPSATSAPANTASTDPFGFASGTPQQHPPVNNGGEQDLLGMFTNIAISGPASSSGAPGPFMQAQTVNSGDMAPPQQPSYGGNGGHTPPRQLTPPRPTQATNLAVAPHQQNLYGQAPQPPPAHVPPPQPQQRTHPSGGQMIAGNPPQQMPGQYQHPQQVPQQQANFYGGQQPGAYGMPPQQQQQPGAYGMPPQQHQQYQQQQQMQQQQMHQQQQMARQGQPQGGSAAPNVSQFDPWG